MPGEKGTDMSGLTRMVMELLEPITARIRFVPLDLPGPTDEDPLETVLDVPGYGQTEEYTCGFTAGLMVLHTFHPSRSPDRFFREVAPDREWGTSTTRLVSALRRNRVCVSMIDEHRFERIAERIEAGEPVITVVSRTAEVDHWVVIYGVRRGRKKLVYVAVNGLPTRRGCVYEWSAFRRIWHPKGSTFACRGR